MRNSILWSSGAVLVAIGASLYGCSSSDNPSSPPATGGSGGAQEAGTGGSATGGSAGQGGTAGEGGLGGSATGGEAGTAGTGGMAGAAGTGGEDGGTAQQLCAEIAALQHDQYVALGCTQDNSAQIQAQCEAIYASLPQCIPAGEALGNCVKQQPASNWECSSSGNPQLKSPYCSAEEDAAQACAMGALDGGDGDGGDAACWAAGSVLQCHQCCAQTHPGGQAAMFAAMGPCLCQASVCQTACAATTCASPPKNPDATCQACLTPSLSTGGACETDFATACAADPLCAVTFACNQGCL